MHEKDQSESAIDLPLSHEQRVDFVFAETKNLWYPYHSSSSYIVICKCLLFAFVSICMGLWIQPGSAHNIYILISPKTKTAFHSLFLCAFLFCFKLWLGPTSIVVVCVTTVLRRASLFCMSGAAGWLALGNPTSLFFPCIHVHYKKFAKPGFPGSPLSLPTLVRKEKNKK